MKSSASTRYDRIAQALHWLIAILILGQLFGGFLTAHNGVPDSWKFSAIQLHKSFGLIILFLSLVRLGWRLGHRPPPLPADMAAWEKIVSKITHIIFYVLMIGIPLAGWLMVSASPLGIETKLFFTIPVPSLPVPVSEQLSGAFSGLHEFLAFAVFGLFILHVAAAAKHFIIAKDDVLQRMAGRGFSAFLALGFAALAGAAILFALATGEEEHDHDHSPPAAESAPAETPAPSPTPTAAQSSAPLWAITKDATYLDVSLTAQGGARTAKLSDITGQIQLDPAAPENGGRIDVTIGIASLVSDDSTTKGQALSADWLDASAFPTARFVSEEISLTEDGHYSVEGMLTIKGVSQPMTLNFTLDIEGDNAIANGDAAFDRMPFGIGAGDAKDTNVSVSVHVEAVKN